LTANALIERLSARFWWIAEMLTLTVSDQCFSTTKSAGFMDYWGGLGAKAAMIIVFFDLWLWLTD
jgi:hypothetical protein